VVHAVARFASKVSTNRARRNSMTLRRRLAHISHFFPNAPQRATSVDHDADDHDDAAADGCSTTTRWGLFAFAAADAPKRG